jgi:hypothetical protein
VHRAVVAALDPGVETAGGLGGAIGGPAGARARLIESRDADRGEAQAQGFGLERGRGGARCVAQAGVPR